MTLPGTSWCGIPCIWVCVVGASGGCRASKGCLGDLFGSSPYSRCSRPVRCILDCLSRACPFRHPTAFLTTRAFYGSDSSPLQGSDLAVFSFVRLSLCLSSLFSLSLLTPFSENPAFPYQQTPSGLPKPMTQSEQQGSSSALIRLLAMRANNNHSLHAHTLI